MKSTKNGHDFEPLKLHIKFEDIVSIERLT